MPKNAALDAIVVKLQEQIQQLGDNWEDPVQYKAVVHPSTFKLVTAYIGKKDLPLGSSVMFWGTRFESSSLVKEGDLNLVKMKTTAPWSKPSLYVTSNKVDLGNDHQVVLEFNNKTQQWTVFLANGDKMVGSWTYSSHEIFTLNTRLLEIGKDANIDLTAQGTVKDGFMTKVKLVTSNLLLVPPVPAIPWTDPAPPEPKLTEFDIHFDLIEDRDW